MTRNPRRKGRHLLIAIVSTLCLCAAPAWASSPIEGVWEFNGGKVAVHPLANGDFEGVVVDQTKFAGCVHPVGQAMWTEIRQEADGSYWGHHQWYFEPGCALNPTPGQTAWRVIRNEKGENVLKVCFSSPESGAQPTIAANGLVAQATYGCTESAPIAKLPTRQKESVEASVSVALQGGTKAGGQGNKCVAHRALTIKLREPKFDPLKEAIVWVNGRKVADVRGVAKVRKAILLKKLPRASSYTIKITAVTVLGHKLTGSHKYKRCGSGSGSIGLQGGKQRPKKHGKKG